MPESMSQPSEDQKQATADERTTSPEAQPTPGKRVSQVIKEEEADAMQLHAPKIIWTPRFLLAFALALILGISMDSLLASGWSTGLLTGYGYLFLLGHIILALAGWSMLGIVTRSQWIRIGCIFGGVCSTFLILNVFTNLFGLDPSAPSQAYINVASCTALLGAYIGLSIEGTLLSAWDLWLFVLVAVLGSIGVALTYMLTPQASLVTIENAVAATVLIAAGLCWWARPSCWKRCPGPTFLFGIVPFIQLSMALVNSSLHNFFFLQVLTPRLSTNANLNNFFFAQLILLCLFLGCLRVAKSERGSLMLRKIHSHRLPQTRPPASEQIEP